MTPQAENETASAMRNTGVARDAFVAAMPVILGYLTMGMAFGVLLVKEVPNANAWWCLGFSAGALSGSMQFAAVEMLKNATAYSLVMTAILAVLINIRYAIYGLSFLRLFRCYPWYLRIFLIHALSDENFAIEASSKRHGKPQLVFITLVSLLDYLSWIAGTILGALIGGMIKFPTDGIDFAMVALFVVILVDLCRDRMNIFPTIVGAVTTTLVIVPAMIFFPQMANKTLPAAIVLMTAVLYCKRPAGLKGGDAK